MRAPPIAIVAFLGTAACADVVTVRYQPSTLAASSSVVVDHGASRVARPGRGDAIAATLADGFPVWVVQHDDATFTVVSAVAPARPPTPAQRRVVRTDVSAQVGRGLVSWIPAVRRFYAAGVVFDERGHALGYADFDGCFGTCPRLDDLPHELRDLDTFAARVVDDAPTHLAVDAIVPGAPRQRASSWIAWRRRGDAGEPDMRAADAPALPRRSLADARTLSDGQYAVVDGSAVRSTHAEPVVCTPTNKPGTCGACGADELPLVGVASSDAAHVHRDGFWRNPAEYRRDRRAVYVEAEPGTFLVQRQGGGFRIVAGVFRGICNDRW